MEKEKIGKYIRKKRIEKGMTQQQLAEKIQVTEKAVSRWETGRGVPDFVAGTIGGRTSCVGNGIIKWRRTGAGRGCT